MVAECELRDDEFAGRIVEVVGKYKFATLRVSELGDKTVILQSKPSLSSRDRDRAGLGRSVRRFNDRTFSKRGQPSYKPGCAALSP